MHERALSAPGKLFLSGEYAVLWGGTARVLAVGPRLQVVVRRRDDRTVQVLLAGGRIEGTATSAGVKWSEPPGPASHFVARALDQAYRAAGKEGPGLALAIEASPTHGGAKLGLGSSARVTVLAVEAARVALEATFDTLKVALVAHYGAQGRKGSGGDVAACLAGGLVRYRRYEAMAALEEASARTGLAGALVQAPPVELSRAPEPTLPLIYAFSGQSASTPTLVRSVEALVTGARRAAFVEQSERLGDRLELALARGDFARASELTQELQTLLDGLGLPSSEGLERILALARGLGCAGKQSGAGGGDGALLVAPDEARAELLLAGLRERGLLATRVTVEAGLRGEGRVEATLTSWLDAAGA